MIFYLGSFRVGWLADSDVPLFVSHRTLRRAKALPRAETTWALDSGAYTELSQHGRWTFPASEYVESVHRYASEIGNLAWIAPRDWMAEPWVRELTGLSVDEHLHRTVESYCELSATGLPVPVIPVLQGWAREEYDRCRELYAEAGVDLAAAPVVGLGSVCRRTEIPAIADLVFELAGDGLRLHGFGVNSAALRRCGFLLESADSLAWSQYARREQRPMLATCSHRKRSGELSDCRNCRDWAMEWRRRAIANAEASEAGRTAGRQGVLTLTDF